MAKTANQQQKLLRLQQIFLRETDENHGLTMEQLLEQLASYGISAERKSIYENIETLNQCGMDILRERRGRETVYYAASRDFEAAELKLLADAVASSRFITPAKSGVLLKKLSGLASRWESADLMRQVHVASRIKSMNETVLYRVDELHRAIARNRAITFCYYDWALEADVLRRTARHGGARYTVSPWQLLWQDEFYYLIAYDHPTESIRHYRVDRMGEITLTELRRLGESAFRAIHMEDYTARLFGMFGGKTLRATLTFVPRLLEVMIDRFGRDIKPSPVEDRVQIRVDLIPSLPFFGWLAGFEGDAVITDPPELREAYRAVLRSALIQQEKEE